MEQKENSDSIRHRAPRGPAAAHDNAPAAQRSDHTAPKEAGAGTKKPRAPHGSKNGRKGSPPPLPRNAAIPAFEPVPRKFRHDGWTPERQRAFIGALADTGCVSHAARYVNMSPEGAYWLRRQAGSDAFRAAWEAALNLGVQRLKDEVFERALEGQLHPVFVGGKLKGFKRVKNDRLLMFALRMNAKDEYGRRMAATYFDPDAPRLHGGSGVSDGGERSKQLSPLPSREGVGGGGSGATSPLPTRITETLTGPAVSQRQKDAHNAALVAQFDPVAMTLPEIEAMQAMLLEAAQRKRAEEDGPAEHQTGVEFIAVREEDAFKALGPLEDIEPVVTEEDREAEFDEEKVRWWDLE
ncbi:MAG: hypothetical protein JNJ92_05760 [Altererythrobacter sp.]|nr:hypothetical protein [Altererythrobacter sp.]